MEAGQCVVCYVVLPERRKLSHLSEGASSGYIPLSISNQSYAVHSTFADFIWGNAAQNLPRRCPHGARYGAHTVPTGKTRTIAQRAIELILVSIMLLIPSRQVREFPFFCSGHRVGTVRAPCGHRAGTERAPFGRSKGEGTWRVSENMGPWK